MTKLQHPEPVDVGYGLNAYIYRAAAIDPTDVIGNLVLGRYVAYSRPYPHGYRLANGRTLAQVVRRACRTAERLHRNASPVDVSLYTGGDPT